LLHKIKVLTMKKNCFVKEKMEKKKAE